jgi:hypothetical protein
MRIERVREFLKWFKLVYENTDNTLQWKDVDIKFTQLETSKKHLYQKTYQYQPQCYFCKANMDANEFYRNKSGKNMDNWVIHHKNHNRADNGKDNLVLGHRTCHLSYHRQLESKEFNETLNNIVNAI